MTTPDTTTEADEAVEEAIYDWMRRGNPESLLGEALAEPLAAIRRQAAADALREQANSLTKTGGRMREQARAHDAKGKRDSSIIYNSLADAYYGSASRLWKAADDKIAEGYEHVCAAYTWATRTDPGYGCDARVPDAGDYCSKHEPEDDENPWAE